METYFWKFANIRKAYVYYLEMSEHNLDLVVSLNDEKITFPSWGSFLAKWIVINRLRKLFASSKCLHNLSDPKINLYLSEKTNPRESIFRFVRPKLIKDFRIVVLVGQTSLEMKSEQVSNCLTSSPVNLHVLWCFVTLTRTGWWVELTFTRLEIEFAIFLESILAMVWLISCIQTVETRTDHRHNLNTNT